MRRNQIALILGLSLASFVAGALSVFTYAWRWLHRPKER